MGTPDLERRISNAQGSEKVDILLEASTIRGESLATILEYALMGIRLAKKIGYEKGLAYGLQRAGSISINLGDVESGIKNLLSSLEHYDKVNDKDGMGESLLLLGKAYLKKGDVPRSAEYFNWSTTEFNKVGDLPGEAAAANNCGFVYKLIGNYDNALESYDNALSIYRRLQDKQNEAVLLSNIAKLYFDKKDYLEAIEFYEEALSVLPEDDQQYKSELLYGLSMAYSRGNDHRRAITALEESKDIKTTLGDHEGVNKVKKALLSQDNIIKGRTSNASGISNEESLTENFSVSEPNLSTDIKNYLTAIIGNAQHLKEHHEDLSSDEIQDLISDIEASAFNIDNALNTYIGQYTVEYEQEVPGLEDVNINEVIDEIIESYNDSLESKGVGLVKHYTGQRYTVRAEKEKLRDVLKQIISNAIEVTPAGKNIYSYLAAEGGGKIRCEIIDEGTGQGSYNLLSSLQDLAKKMGGTLSYEGMTGGGGTFILIFNESKN